METASTSTVTERALYNEPLQTDERRALVSAICRVTLVPLAAERQDVRRKRGKSHGR
jgi:hypothetical protein